MTSFQRALPACDEMAERGKLVHGYTLAQINEERHRAGLAPHTEAQYRQLCHANRIEPNLVPPTPAPEAVALPKPAPPNRPKALGEKGTTLHADFSAKRDSHTAMLEDARDELSRVQGIASENDEEIAALKAGGSSEDHESVQRLSLLLARKELLPNDITTGQNGVKRATAQINNEIYHSLSEGAKVLAFIEQDYNTLLARDLAWHCSDPATAQRLLDIFFHVTDFAKALKPLLDEKRGMRTDNMDVQADQTSAWLAHVDAFTAKWILKITGAK